ncbi:MAG: hypothetical protein A2268_11655 [Candidatus Raymondbacteria bacterium RifOxyA12_full_50_37]|uniref:Uncharacterized protein n=1 Tax=Candidatus Raymondbacteria bacterium RIFOXYD12_FULL_49_13 TaxID=1817890 RepID=A0A1F7F3N1_UNCRA|nr:MAG: hypothetical protein A2268_11655 [Candidatus Raymondbacteria bacterium RifOxyA12_full_50_37]OGJ85993.1 MAG: hypothetical protein A2248_00490 [Candidatus Raymondbacteria bacterium RIFOXYA2_FULL_49_16]OGJ97125.1 MAG: hypothetical protein A2453_12430 [Candidatus Raymondbacteria bacterium RIFOXYC2_FULL_50_21]OGK01172.1 MAG: hypothetical protein A2519_01465 [Candidatus Raymondbacteria bacterium RIFOXYD12_FULL_49_13]OGP40200.1 MAG: hypothetical protein A2324_14660 [Candidatus Raymondbacteria 
METVAGAWIDHWKAVVVNISDSEVSTQEILPNVEKQPGRFNSKRSTASFESQLVQADDHQQREFSMHLNEYYGKVMSCLKNFGSVLVFGPGEAKGELIKLMERNRIDTTY